MNLNQLNEFTIEELEMIQNSIADIIVLKKFGPEKRFKFSRCVGANCHSGKITKVTTNISIFGMSDQGGGEKECYLVQLNPYKKNKCFF